MWSMIMSNVELIKFDVIHLNERFANKSYPHLFLFFKVLKHFSIKKRWRQEVVVECQTKNYIKENFVKLC